MGSRVEVTETPRCGARGPHKAWSSESRSHPMYLDYVCTLNLHFARSDLRMGGRNSTPHLSDIKAPETRSMHLGCYYVFLISFRDCKLVQLQSFGGTNRPRIYRESSFDVGWMRGTLICVIPSLSPYLRTTNHVNLDYFMFLVVPTTSPTSILAQR